MGVWREWGGVMIWRRRRCSSYAQPLGFCVLCLGKGGKYVRGPRERGGRRGREGVSRNEGGKYKREKKVMEGFDSFGFLLLSPSSRLCQ